MSAPDVKLGPVHTPQMDVLVRDLSGVSEALGTRVDAIVGFDLLGRSAFTDPVYQLFSNPLSSLQQLRL